MRVSAAGNMPLQGLVKPPAKPVVMITFFYLTAEGRRIQRELHLSHIEKLHAHHMYVTKARKMSKNRTLSKFRGRVKREKG